MENCFYDVSKSAKRKYSTNVTFFEYSETIYIPDFNFKIMTHEPFNYSVDIRKFKYHQQISAFSTGKGVTLL